MKVVVIPDIHLKPWMFDFAQEILCSGQADGAVCLMDIADDWDKYYDTALYKETYDRAIAFAKKFPETLWCYGNHDISYLWGKLETGYSPYAEKTVMSQLECLKNTLKTPRQLAFVHRIDRVIFSHGGLCQSFVKGIGKKDIDDVLDTINKAGAELLWKDDSPLWF